MARTKLGAKNATGGTAPRVALGVSPAPAEAADNADSRAGSMEVEDMDDIVEEDDADVTQYEDGDFGEGGIQTRFCMLCSNGGTLFQCELCQFAVCSDLCIQDLKFIPTHVLDDLVFLCPRCQSKDAAKCRLPFGGMWHKGTDTPFHSKGMCIVAPQCLSPESPLHLPTIGIVDLHSEEIKTLGFPAEALRVYLQGIYTGCANRIFFADVKYGNLSRSSDLKKVRDRQATVVARMSTLDEVIIVLSTHSDNESGDIIYKDGVGAVSVADYFNSVISPLLGGLKRARVNVSMFLVTCAGTMSNRESRKAVQKAAADYGIKRLFAFPALALFPHRTSAFINEAIYTFVLHREKESDAMLKVLGDSQSTGRHTPIYTFLNGTVTAYTWANPVIRPFGVSLPFQCPSCRAWWTWNEGKAEKNGTRFTCKGKSVDGEQCRQTFFAPNDLHGSIAVKSSHGGWMRKVFLDAD